MIFWIVFIIIAFIGATTTIYFMSQDISNYDIITPIFIFISFWFTVIVLGVMLVCKLLLC